MERDLTALKTFLEKHEIGVDELFFVLHLGARSLSQKTDVPLPVRQRWLRVAEECHDLWHNTLRSGTRLV